MLAIELPAEIEKRLETVAKHAGQSKSDCARQAILDYVEDLEYAHLAAERLQEGGGRWTQEEMGQGFDLNCQVGQYAE